MRLGVGLVALERSPELERRLVSAALAGFCGQGPPVGPRGALGLGRGAHLDHCERLEQLSAARREAESVCSRAAVWWGAGRFWHGQVLSQAGSRNRFSAPWPELGRDRCFAGQAQASECLGAAGSRARARRRAEGGSRAGGRQAAVRRAGMMACTSGRRGRPWPKAPPTPRGSAPPERTMRLQLAPLALPGA